MDFFRVEGNARLRGEFVPKGNKNAALPIIAACLLTNESITLHNLPEIEDVKIMLQILEDLGGTVIQKKQNTYQIKVDDLHKTEIDPALGSLIRTSILFAGPMLARLKAIKLPKPGGDGIGKRRLDSHFLVFEQLGAKFRHENYFELSAPDGLSGCFIYLDEASVTATENAIMASVLARGKTTIYNAACEPHIQDLCNFLNTLGAKISGICSNRLEIVGVEFLHGGEWEIISDHIEVGSMIGLAAVTGSELTILHTNPLDYINIRHHYNKLGVDFIIGEDRIFVPQEQKKVAQNDIDGSITTLADSVWPGFPSDLTSIAVVMATLIKGQVLIFEKMFESRLFFVDKLVGMGAKIILCDPHRAVVSGPNKLFGGKIFSPDIRAGMAMLIAALAAEGESVIQNIRQIDRGYEKIDERLNALGAHIVRFNDCNT